MRRRWGLWLMSVAVWLLSACSASVHVPAGKPLPPGQMKKVTGSQSAKPYAPGQQKKKK